MRNCALSSQVTGRTGSAKSAEMGGANSLFMTVVATADRPRLIGVLERVLGAFSKTLALFCCNSAHSHPHVRHVADHP